MTQSRGSGGRRPGAGAPKGNINALQTGAHSKQLRELLDEVPQGFFVLNKKQKRMVFLRKKENIKKLNGGGLEI